MKNCLFWQRWVFTARKNGTSSLHGTGNTRTVRGRTGRRGAGIGKRPEQTNRSGNRRRWGSRRHWSSTPEKPLKVWRPIGSCTNIALPMLTDPPPRKTTRGYASIAFAYCIACYLGFQLRGLQQQLWPQYHGKLHRDSNCSCISLQFSIISSIVTAITI